MATSDYISGPHDTPCVCRHDGLRWTRKCATAAVADNTTAGRWAAQHIQANPTTQFSPEYRALAGGIPNSGIQNEDLR